jgi:hypothetical protein
MVSSRNYAEVLTVVWVLSLSLVLRLLGLNLFVVSDEVRWTCRSIGFRQALIDGNWAGTFRTGHPGVVTTWLGGMFTPWRDVEPQTKEACTVSQDASDLSHTGESARERTGFMHAVGELLFKGRRGVAIFTWLCTVGQYLLIRRAWGARGAALSLVLIALDPFYLGHSRFLHIDAVLTSLMSLSVLSLLVFLRQREPCRKRTWFLVLSGMTGGLAFLQKSPALFLGPFVALVVALDLVDKGLSRESLLRWTRSMIVWSTVALAVYVALWPAVWVQPLGTVRRVLDTATGYAQAGHSSGNYFLGRPDEDPGWLFYPVVALFRLSPLTLLGLVVAPVSLLTADAYPPRGRFGLAILLLYSWLFGIFMSLGDKMFDRYLLPVFPALELVAAIALMRLVDRIWKRRSRALWFPLCSVALVIQAGLALSHHPRYLTYYNPLLGGIMQAKRVLLVGWGEGYEKAAAYLNAKPDAEDLHVAVPAFNVFSPQFRGMARPMQRYAAWETDYVMFYLSHAQRQRYPDLMGEYLQNPRAEPEHVVSLRGVDYVWLYRNDSFVGPLRYIAEHGRPDLGECILVNGGALFAKHYRGGLQLLLFDTEYDLENGTYAYWTPEQVVSLWNGNPSECRRIWYVRYPEGEGDRYADLLEKQALLLDQVEFLHIELTLHERIDLGEAARQPTDLQFDGLQLLGFGVTEPPPTWGHDGGVVMEWRALSPVAEDYSVYLHLYDSQGHRLAQADVLISDVLSRPTSRWQPGESNSGLIHLPIAPGTPPGEYDLEVGVYLWKTGKKLPLQGAEEARFSLKVGVPDEPPHVAELRIPHWVEQEVAPELRLLGYDVGEASLVTGGTLYLRLFWEAVQEMDAAFRLRLGLRGADGNLYGERQFAIVNTDYPTNRWRIGELLQERYYLPVSEALPTGEAVVELDLLDESGHSVLSDPVTVTEVWVQSTRPSLEVPTRIAARREAILADNVDFLGYELESFARPGGDVEVTVYWQARRDIDEPYKAFVHLYDDTGAIVSQRDRLPGLGARPTEVWEAGEVVTDRFRVPIERDVPPGEYRLAVGLYHAETGERLVASGPDGRRLEQDRIMLGLVTIGP